MFLVGLNGAQKGVEIEVSLNKTALFMLPSIIGDTYFSDQNNVEKVVFLYRSMEGNQEKSIVFRLEDPVPTALFSFSVYSRDQFALAAIKLYDFDGGHFRVPMQEIPNLDIDFSMQEPTLADMSTLGGLIQGLPV